MSRDALKLVALCLAVRIGCAWIFPAEPVWDGHLYATLARTLLTEGRYAFPHVWGGENFATAYYPVGYPAALAASLWVTRSARLAAVALNLLAALVALLSVRALARRAGVSANVAAALYALAPGAALWCSAAMTETLTGALLSLSLALTLRPLASGLALGVAALVRPQSLLAGLFVGRGGGLRARALLLLAALCLLAPWSARNCRALGRCALVSTNGGVNLYIGTLPDARGGYRPPGVIPGCAGLTNEVARDRCAAAVARTRILAHPLRWAALSLVKLARTLAWEPSPARYLRSALPDALGGARATLLAALCTAAWWALIALSVRGFRARRSLGPAGARALEDALGAAAAVLVAHAVFLGDDRHHLAVVPLMAPAAAHGWSLTARGFEARFRRRG